MINAHEAKRRTLMASKYKSIRDEIEKSIDVATKAGFYSTSIVLHESDKEIVRALCVELMSLGYKAKYEPVKPWPYGCSVDQVDLNSYLRISWDEEKGER